MGNNLDCPKQKWICITICSQGTEGVTCNYYKHEEEEDTLTINGNRVLEKTVKKNKKIQGKVSEAGRAVIGENTHDLEGLYASAIYVDESITECSESLHIEKVPHRGSDDHEPHALNYAAIWQEKSSRKMERGA